MKNDGKTNISLNEKKLLRKQFDQYYAKYTKLVEDNIVPYENIPNNKVQLKTNLLDLTQKSKEKKIDIVQKTIIFEILANLFAIWTISDFHKNKL